MPPARLGRVGGDAALLLEHTRRQLDSTVSAVTQLDSGASGRCAKCGGDIGQERLGALVDVTTCVTCAGSPQ